MGRRQHVAAGTPPDGHASEEDMNFEDYPGYLGRTSKYLLVALHADWPAYPVDHGWETALFYLCSFPEGTTFVVVDDIDRCLLLRADYPIKHPKAKRIEMHVAVWHEDMLDLASRGLVAGAEFGNERDWRSLERSKLRESIRARPADRDWTGVDPRDTLYMQHPDGSMVRLVLPSLDMHDDAPDDKSWFLATSDGLEITGEGHQTLSDLAVEGPVELPYALSHKVTYLLDGGLLDTAVREVSVALEAAMKARTGANSFGRRLVRDFFDALRDEGRWLTSALRTDETEITAAFQFVRNEFAHNTVALTSRQARALVLRMAHALTTVTSYAATAPDQSPPIQGPAPGPEPQGLRPRSCHDLP